ncbi:MAG TPA: divergent polysaccharide deacetylase family protein [Thermoanaerobaculia bacterium]|nr:divergent polysaccharide deacetylase family protein [Thermoanaerobaculia bacterium]
MLWKRTPSEPTPPVRVAKQRPAPRPSENRATPPRPAAHRSPAPEEGIVLAEDPVTDPRLAIVVDDLGNDDAALGRVAALREPLAGAVLPGLPHSRETALALRAAGKEVLLHLPMEPLDPRARPGPGLVRTGMTAAQIAGMLSSDLEDVPGASGVNNHMGSRATADRKTMDAVLSVVGKRGLFFLDSRTTAFTVAAEEAGRLGVPCLSRSVFLDDVADESAIRIQLERAAGEARSQGAAVAIGHPHPATLAVLERELPRLGSEGIRLVTVAELLARQP